MLSQAQVGLFEKYNNAGGHAFSTGEVSDLDKDLYQGLFEQLQEATKASIASLPFSEMFEVWSCKFGRDGGMQGHRPLDLWSSVINVESESFGRCPQVYVIASERGLEIGFSVTIHEDDYYNQAVKQRQRNIVPILNRKLPDSDSNFVIELDAALAADGVWSFGEKTRQYEGTNFGSLSRLIAFLKSSESSLQGGGSIYRIIGPDQITSADFDLNATFAQALDRFAPLMRLLIPSPSEDIKLRDQQTVDKAANQIPDFDPKNLEDGRKKVLQHVAVRQGQAKFREKLFDAYGGCCAVTGTSIAATLQAAHIVPFRGPDTNTVQNGILLRADVHNLFDLGLIQIHPTTLSISLADEIKSTAYKRLAGRKLRLPEKVSERPSSAALAERTKMFLTSEANDQTILPFQREHEVAAEKRALAIS